MHSVVSPAAFCGGLIMCEGPRSTSALTIYTEEQQLLPQSSGQLMKYTILQIPSGHFLPGNWQGWFGLLSSHMPLLWVISRMFWDISARVEGAYCSTPVNLLCWLWNQFWLRSSCKLFTATLQTNLRRMLMFSKKYFMNFSWSKVKSRSIPLPHWNAKQGENRDIKERIVSFSLDSSSFVSQNALPPAVGLGHPADGVIIVSYYQRSTLSFLFQSQTSSGLSGVPDIGVAVNEGNTQS